MAARPKQKAPAAGISVIETVEVPLKDLQPFPGNPRNGDIEAIEESVAAHGQFRALVVQKSTNYVIAGNHTLHALLGRGYETGLVHYLDVDDEQAKRILLADNRLNDRASYDDAQLATLLQSLEGDFTGTGYDDRALEKVLAQIAKDEQTALDPDPQQIPESFDVLVSCGSESAQVELLERLTAEGLTCKALVA